MTRIGTAHYRSEAEAKRNYNGNYEEAIKEGRIVIGRPELKPGDKLLVDKDGRYIIERE